MKNPSLLRAIIFDFNGIILDDEEYHYQSLNMVLQEEGVSITREDYYRDCLGFNDMDCFLWGLKDSARITNAGGMEKLIIRKSAYYQELLRQATRFFPGVLQFIKNAAQRYHLAVASMAMREEIDYALRKGNVRECFHVILGAEDIENVKPDPEAYEKALEGLNRLTYTGASSPLLPSECLVIEDSSPGIRAAKAAGMRCLAITNTVGAESLGDADWTIATLEGLSLEKLYSMFEQAG